MSRPVSRVNAAGRVLEMPTRVRQLAGRWIQFCCNLLVILDDSKSFKKTDDPKTSATGFEYTLVTITTTLPTLSR